MQGKKYTSYWLFPGHWNSKHRTLCITSPWDAMDTLQRTGWNPRPGNSWAFWGNAGFAEVHSPHFTDDPTEVQGWEVSFLSLTWPQLQNECLPLLLPVDNIIPWAVYLHCNQSANQVWNEGLLSYALSPCLALWRRTRRAECRSAR